MRLDIGMIGAKDLFGALARQILDDISKLAAAVIAFPWVSLSVFVGKNRAGSLQDSHADKVL
jgi:hypothetical protein